MKLYRYIMGVNEKYGVAADEQDAYDRRAEVDHTFSFLPVRIEEVIVPGYVIRAVSEEDLLKEGNPEPPEGEDGPNDFDAMDKDQLRSWLKERGIKFFNGASEDQLRELARNA